MGRRPRAGSLVAGIGFRAGTLPDEIATLLRQALATLPNRTVLAAIATAADRADEAPIRIAAAAFGLVPIPLQPAALAAVDSAVPTRSARIEASRGIGSVAEAAALAAAGEGGRLVLHRIASAGATCALAMTAASAAS